jgi:hypothetical protein
METKQDVRDVLIRVVRIENSLDCHLSLLNTLQTSIAALTCSIAGLQPLPVQPPAQVFPLFAAPHFAEQSQLPAAPKVADSPLFNSSSFVSPAYPLCVAPPQSAAHSQLPTATGFQQLPIQPPAPVLPHYTAQHFAAESQLPVAAGLQPLPVQPPAQMFPDYHYFAAQFQLPVAAGLQLLPVHPPAQGLPLVAATQTAPLPATAQEAESQIGNSSSCENQVPCTFAGCELISKTCSAGKVKTCSAAKSLRHMEACVHCTDENLRYLHIAQHMTVFERHPRVVDLDVCCWCSDRFATNQLPDARSRHKTACLQKAITCLQVGGFLSYPLLLFCLFLCCNHL